LHWYEQTSRWAAAQIVHKLQLKQRVATLERLIKLAEELMKINNYNGVMEILSGINSSPVRRLKKTWEVRGCASVYGARSRLALILIDG